MDSQLLQQDELGLQNICREIPLGDQLFANKNKRQLLRLIRKSIDVDDDIERAEILKRIKERMQLIVSDDKKNINTELPTVASSVVGAANGQTTANVVSLEETLKKTMLKKEFKIVGQITDAKKNDRPSISFISLIHQLEAGQRQGYNGEELITGVIKCMAPGMKLRTVLETLPGLKLPRLRLMLRCHFQEKAPADLFQLLSNSVQTSEETADEFVMRVYELRQKLIFARKERSVVPYDDALIQSMFINTIETGLTNESIRNKIRKYLVIPRTGDTEVDFEPINDELIYQTNLAASVELERSEKMRNATRRRASLAAVATEEELPTSPVAKKNVSFQHTDDQLLATLLSIQSQLGTLKKEVNSMSDTRNNQPRYSNKCQKCTKENMDHCFHCFKCGDDSHFARGCRISSNANRPR